MIVEMGQKFFGFLEGTPYDVVSDNISDLEFAKNPLTEETIIRHVESLDRWMMASNGAYVTDVYTGEKLQAGIYRDGNYVFPVEILTYLRRGKIGVPKEYEDYVLSSVQ